MPTSRSRPPTIRSPRASRPSECIPNHPPSQLRPRKFACFRDAGARATLTWPAAEKPSSESKPPSAAVVLVPRSGLQREGPGGGARGRREGDKPSKPNSKHATARRLRRRRPRRVPARGSCGASSARRTPSVSAAAGPAPQQQPPEPAKPKKPESFSMARPRHARRLRRPGPLISLAPAAPAAFSILDFLTPAPAKVVPADPAAPPPLELTLAPAPSPAAASSGSPPALAPAVTPAPGAPAGASSAVASAGRAPPPQAALERGLAADAAPLAAAFADPAALAAERRAVLFFVSSFGDGEPPESAQRLWAWLCDPARPANALAGLLFGLFGNGSRVYDQYQRFPASSSPGCGAGGARPARGGRGPEEEPVLEWELEAAGPGPPSRRPSTRPGASRPRPSSRARRLLAARVLENRELHGPASPDSTRHALAARLGLPPSLLDEPVVPRGPGVPPEIRGVPSTRRALLARAVDVTKPATRRLLAALAPAASNIFDSERMRLLSRDAKAFAAWRAAERRTPLEVLNEFASCAPGLGLLLGALPRVRPCLYSIASSPAVDPSTLAVAVKHVRYATASGAAHEGLCSAFLARLPVLGAAHVFVRRSRFEPPKDPATPLLMVATGSGVGPFLGFLQERSAGRGAGRGAGPAALVLGARSEAELLYRDELAELRGEGTLASLHPPSRGSRAPPRLRAAPPRGGGPRPRGGRPRRRRGRGLRLRLGRRRMPRPCAPPSPPPSPPTGRGSPAEGEALVARMRAEGRYKEDCW
eukprot:tig00021127_g18677.t1